MNQADILEQHKLPIFDTLYLREDPFIKQFLRLNDEEAAAKTDQKKSIMKLFAAKDVLVDPEPEDVKLSCHIQKINKHGLKQSRALMITQKGIYNISKKKTNWKINRSIDIHRVEAMTICQPVYAAKSNELIIHVEKEYDYRYVAPGYKNTLVNVVRKAVNRQVQLGFRKISKK